MVAVPALGFAAGGLEHPAADLDDGAGLFGHGDEVGRRDPASLGVAPANQSLGPSDPPGGRLHDRLVVQDEFLAVQGAPQVAGQRKAVQDAGVEVVVVDLVAAALLLGRVHGRVGVAEQAVELLTLVPQGDPGAGLGQDLTAVHHDWVADPCKDPAGHGLGLGLVGGREDDRELVATDPGRGVGRSKAGPQPVGHLDQNVVAGGVAQVVVDLLEAVQVEHGDGEVLASASRIGHGLGETVVGQGPVGEPGERIVEGLMGELVLASDPLKYSGELAGDGGHHLE
jgi:hypothetical protein